MDRLSVRKLYIDSRYRASGTASNFEYELPETVELPKNTRAFITEFTGVNGWDTVNLTNNNFYLIEQQSNSTIWRARVLTIPENAYDTDSLRSTLEGLLNFGNKMVPGAYTVTRTTSAGDATSAASGAAYRFYTIKITGGGSFIAPPESFLRDPEWMQHRWIQAGGDAYDTTNPKSTNELFSFDYPKLGRLLDPGRLHLHRPALEAQSLRPLAVVRALHEHRAQRRPDDPVQDPSRVRLRNRDSLRALRERVRLHRGRDVRPQDALVLPAGR